MLSVNTNGTINCVADADSGASGNPFDQVLNTTSNVTFNVLNVTTSVGTDLNPFADSLFSLGTAAIRWLNGFFDFIGVETLNATSIDTGIITSGNWSNVTITESQISNLFHNGTTDTNETGRFDNLTTTDCSAGEVVQGINTNGTVNCVVDANTGGGGNIFDQVLNTTSNVSFNTLNVSVVNSDDWSNVTITEAQVTDLFHNGTTDTNETARFDFLVLNDCAVGELVIGVQPNGTVLCSTDADSGASNLFDQVLNTTSNVTFTVLNVTTSVGTDLNPFGDSLFSLGTTVLRWLNGFFDFIGVTTLNATQINTDGINTTNWRNVSITEAQVSDLFHNGTTDTNETARFDFLVLNDCAAGELVIGVQTNGTVLCATDADSGSANPFDQVLNTTSIVTFDTVNVTTELNMTSGNITAVNCVVFANGGQICQA